MYLFFILQPSISDYNKIPVCAKAGAKIRHEAVTKETLGSQRMVDRLLRKGMISLNQA